jgi:hypothetical protein
MNLRPAHALKCLPNNYCLSRVSIHCRDKIAHINKCDRATLRGAYLVVSCVAAVVHELVHNRRLRLALDRDEIDGPASQQ